MKIRLFLIILSLAYIMSSQALTAQIDVKGKVKDQSINRADQRTSEGIEKGLDAVEEGVKSAFKKKDKKAKEEGETEEEADEAAASEESSDETSAKAKKPEVKKDEPAKLTSFTKYDFVPGDQVLLYEDFSQDEVGDFPALWTTDGSGEVRTLNNYPGKWLYLNATEAAYSLMKDLELPDNFIIEFDVVPTEIADNEGVSGFYLSLYNGTGEFLDNGIYPGVSGFNLTCNQEHWVVNGYKEGAIETTAGETTLAPIEINKMNHVIIWVQKRRLRVYHRGQKALDLPTVLYDGVKYNRFRVSLWSMQGFPYITNLRFTTAKPDTRNKLLTEGKLVSYGIYFDVNSDKVKPESYGALSDIAKVLKENPTVKVKIVGHTDADGDDAKNLDLSKRRAAAVKEELSKSFGVSAANLETDGKGESQPLAPNDVPANKAKNRRVEFIKL
jgi:flagellar motor protein MotB